MTGTIWIDPAGWHEGNVRIRGSLTGSPPWTVPISGLRLRWGRVEGASAPRLFVAGAAFGDRPVPRCRAIRIDIDRGRESRQCLHVWLRVAGDERVTRVTLHEGRTWNPTRDARRLREDQAIGLRAALVAWLERVGCEPMRV